MPESFWRAFNSTIRAIEADEICPVSGDERPAVIENRQGMLALVRNCLLNKFAF